MKFYRFILIIFLTIHISGCVEKTTYSGKLFNEKSLSNLNIRNKTDLVKNLGSPSYIDEFNNQYFYYTEMKKNKNFYNNKIEYSYLFVFQLDGYDKVISSESINLLEDDIGRYQKNITLSFYPLVCCIGMLVI